MYIVHDDQLYLNGLDTCTLCTMHEQDSVMARAQEDKLYACYCLGALQHVM